MFLAAFQPMKVEWKMSSYFGVLPLVFKALETLSLCWAQGITQTPGLAITVALLLMSKTNIVKMSVRELTPCFLLGVSHL